MSFEYPEVGFNDEVLYATQPNASPGQWRIAKVRRPKNNSADLIVYGERGVEFKHDCLHVDDPRCDNPGVWQQAGRGVFKLCKREMQMRKDRERMGEIERELAALKRHVENVAMMVSPSRRKAG